MNKEKNIKEDERERRLQDQMLWLDISEEELYNKLRRRFNNKGLFWLVYKKYRELELIYWSKTQ